MGDKGFKAFCKGMTCRNKQYEEGKVFQENGNEICEAGMMHYCKEPQDVLRYYPLLDNGADLTEFADVEALGKVKTIGTKSATNVLRIGKKMHIKDYISACANAIHERVRTMIAKESPGAISDEGQDFTNVSVRLHNAIIETTGYGDRIETYGSFPTMHIHGANNHIISHSPYSVIFTEGTDNDISIMRRIGRVCSTGEDARISLHGPAEEAYASGRHTRIAAYRDAYVRADGDYSIVCGMGHSSAIAVGGRDSIGVALDDYSCAKGVLGCWIVLAEYGIEISGVKRLKCVRAGKIDGEKLKPDVLYRLENGEFVAYEEG